MTDAELLDQFVQAFEKLDALLAFEPVAPELDGGMDDSQWARQRWKPAALTADPAELTEIYSKLPGHFPPLYEQLVLSYRWLEVELDGIVELFPNPPGPGIAILLSKIIADPVLIDVLFPHGLIPFGKAVGGSYDPICFDTCRRHADGDCPIVRIEHEAILCNQRLGKSWEAAHSFRSLVQAIVSRAANS